MKGPSDVVSEITPEDLERIRRHYRVPSDVFLRVPEAVHRVSSELDRGVFFYEESLRAGLRFPLHPLIQELMRFYNICPTMVAPNSWRNIVGFISLCSRIGVTATLPLFRVCHNLVSGRSSEWPYIGPRRSFKMISDNPSSIKEWKPRFFIAEGNIGLDFPMGWTDYVKDPKAHPELSEREKHDLGVLRSGRALSAVALLSEDALFEAGLSPINPRGKTAFTLFILCCYNVLRFLSLRD